MRNSFYKEEIEFEISKLKERQMKFGNSSKSHREDEYNRNKKRISKQIKKLKNQLYI